MFAELVPINMDNGVFDITKQLVMAMGLCFLSEVQKLTWEEKWEKFIDIVNTVWLEAVPSTKKVKAVFDNDFKNLR